MGLEGTLKRVINVVYLPYWGDVWHAWATFLVAWDNLHFFFFLMRKMYSKVLLLLYDPPCCFGDVGSEDTLASLRGKDQQIASMFDLH